jgi:galactosamine-6-phosphate isomerase
MKIFIADNYNDLSEQAAKEVMLLMQERKNPLICTASGDTPAGLYQAIVNKVSKKQSDISNWSFIGLDEWTGMNGKDEGSCRFHLNNQLFYPLQVPDDHVFFFDGRAKDLQEECSNAELFILHHTIIDVAILGLGMNGHIGMNEPGTSPTLHSHITTLDPITKKTGQKYFKNEQKLTDGITLGLATLLQAKHIILLVSGLHKAGIVKQVVEGEISGQLPASLLRNHPGLKVYLDKEAGSLLQAIK